MKEVLFLSGRTMNDALAAAGRAHRPLIEGLGYEFVNVDFSTPNAQDVLSAAMSRNAIAFAYSPAGGGHDMRATDGAGREVNLWEAMRVPFISLNADNPAYFYDRHVMPSPWHACLYFFPEHLELRRRFGPLRGLFGVVPPMPFDKTDLRSIDLKRKAGGKLLFLKNGNDPDKLVQLWRESLPPDMFVLLSGMASDLAANLDTTTACEIDAFAVGAVREHGWDLEGVRNLRLYIVAQLDDYLRRIKSALVADAIADFPVEIHGFNWEHMDFSGRRATFVPGGDYTASRQWIVDSLGMIDMSPNTQLAPHDRAMRAFGLYTLCITNRQSFFEDHVDGSDSFMYRFDKDEIQAKIADVLSRPKEYVDLGVHVAESFRKGRDPELFAQHLVATADLVRAACQGRHPGSQDFFVWPPAAPL